MGATACVAGGWSDNLRAHSPSNLLEGLNTPGSAPGSFSYRPAISLRICGML